MSGVTCKKASQITFACLDQNQKQSIKSKTVDYGSSVSKDQICVLCAKVIKF